jgi:hydroxymethylbilane synthase
MTNRTIRIATRGSKLALYQANRVKGALEEHFPGRLFEIRIIKTKGDQILDVALSKIGDKGLFTKELENSILRNETDLAVHSLKDIPTELPGGLKLGGVLERGEVRDALVSIHGKKLHELDNTDVIATSSLRRRAQLLHFNNKLNTVDIRGNVETRLQKMAEGYCTAMIMACAGLQRLGLEGKISEILDPEVMIPAVSQGAIAIEIRDNDPETEGLIREISHLPTFLVVSAERAFLHALEGGCQVPIGCHSEVDRDRFRISGFVSHADGTGMLKDTLEGQIADAEKIANSLAQRFLELGAHEIIEKIRSSNKP